MFLSETRLPIIGSLFTTQPLKLFSLLPWFQLSELLTEAQRTELIYGLSFKHTTQVGWAPNLEVHAPTACSLLIPEWEQAAQAPGT